MATAIGKAVILFGTVKAVAPDGTERVLEPNSVVYANERIITESDGSVSIMLDGPPPSQIDLGRMSDVLLDEDVYAAGPATADAMDMMAEAERILEALEGDEDIEIDATAAGAGGGAGGGLTLVKFDADGNEILPDSGAETQGVSFGTTDTIEGIVGEEPPETPPDLPDLIEATATLTSEGWGDEDAGTVTYTVTVDHAPQADQDFTFTLSNGQVVTVTVAEGDLSGETILAWGMGEDLPAGAIGLDGYPDPDVYLEDDFDLEVVEDSFAAVGNAANYESLDVADNSETITIGDTIDTVTATLTSEGAGTEDAGTVTYTVTVDHAPQADQDFTFTLSNGQVVTVTVAEGDLSGETILAWGMGEDLPAGAIGLDGYPDPDVYLEDDFDLEVVEDSFAAVGNAANYESLDVADNSETITI
ncbi:MAG: retention module-containing protein, partial [Syntrophales bacterium]|nr:retention module-containing protein [Syntrophales bacterium]